MELKQNWLDKMISFVSPSAGADRLRARAVEQAFRGYDGASKSRRTSGWHTSNNSANTETRIALGTLRNRARELVRNNAYAGRAVQVIVANTVGTGIIAQAKSVNKRRQNIAEGLWHNWAETTQIDAAGHHDFYGLQALVMRTVVESGECLILRRRRGSSDALTVPMQIEVLEPDFIDNTKDVFDLIDGGKTVQGIEFNGQGKRVAYWLYENHPGDFKANVVSRRVLAEDVCHIYRVDRPGQDRGIPWLSPVMMPLYDLGAYEDATLTRLRVAACFAGFVRDIEGVPTNKAPPISDKLEPGALEILPPGRDIVFNAPPGAEGASEYARHTLRAISAGLGITYESMTGDLSNVNFSSGRMGWLEFQRNIESWRWHMLIPQFCTQVWDWFIESGSVRYGDVFGEVTAQFTPPRREMIDPSKEISATISAIRGGLVTQSEAIRQGGYDPESVYQEMAADNARFDALGLVLDSDARKTMKAGSLQMSDAPVVN